MRSKAWRDTRAAWWATYDKKYRNRCCYVCGIPQSQTATRSLDLHHVTYERLGKERFNDIRACCRPCHDIITKRWRARKRTGLTLTLLQLTDQVRAEKRKRVA